jgi:hypothetical protein
LGKDFSRGREVISLPLSLWSEIRAKVARETIAVA